MWQLTKAMTMTAARPRTMHLLWTALALALALATGQPEMAVSLVPGLASPAQPQDGGWQQEIGSWRAQHAVELQKPDGWLALAGLEWLEAGDNSVGSAKDNKIHLPSGGQAHLAVLHRGERCALRIKDAKSPALTGFHGLKRYRPNQAYRVTARWIPYSPQKTFTIATLIGTSYPAQIPGTAEFKLKGKTYRLDPILEDPAVTKLFFVLRDTTSSSTTYGACRFLYTGFPDHGLDK